MAAQSDALVFLASWPPAVETLKGLLRSFLPCWEPQEDATPTPSVAGTDRRWVLVQAAQDPGSPEVPMESRGPSEPPGRPLADTGGDSLTGPEASGSPAAERALRGESEIPGRPFGGLPEAGEQATGYKVVRKGNYFYVSLPVDLGESHTEDGGSSPTEAPQPPAPSAGGSLQALPGGQRAEDSPAQPCAPLEGPLPRPATHLELSPSGQMTRDADAIFRTIEQLTAKVTRLKDVEQAHQLLLRSLSKAGPAISGSVPPEPRGAPPLDCSATLVPSPVRLGPAAAPAQGGSVPPPEDAPQDMTL